MYKKNGPIDSDITITKLISRDGNRCYLCNDEVDLQCDKNSKKAPTIEHVIPVSKGGTHTWNNVKLACRDCNVLKSDKLTTDIPPA
ncbi:HNH endonuclease [Metabacillus sp. 84]|uniref:HNH endonuclease n=1 Tax=Metabacillus sp. 84 TaxID=3404705 RepID=UPI003CFB4B72